MKLSAFLASLCVLLAACAPGQLLGSTLTPTPTINLTPTSTSTQTPTTTPSPTATPEPAWLQIIRSQDPEAGFIILVDGHPVIDLYDTEEVENILLNETSINLQSTSDVLYPEIITARDAGGSQYAFNPGLGWFLVPKVQLDYHKVAEYTPVNVDYFTDGCFALVSALTYAENPTISPDAPVAQFWVNAFHGNPATHGYSNFLYISMTPTGSYGFAEVKWPELILYFTPENKPFAWTGLYKVFYDDGADYFYTLGRTMKISESQTQSLAYGFGRFDYERKQFNLELDGMFELINYGWGDKDLIMIIAPPNDSIYSWYPDSITNGGWLPNPVVANLQQRGELISLFSPEDQSLLIDVLNGIPIEYARGATTPLWTAPLTKLPPEFSKYILLAGYG